MSREAVDRYSLNGEIKR